MSTAITRTQTFTPGKGAVRLFGLTGSVTVRPNPGATVVTLNVQADQAYHDALAVTRPEGGHIDIREPHSSRGGSRVVQVNTFSRGGRSVSTSSINGVVVTGDGNVVVSGGRGGRGGRIVVNGVDVTEAVNGAPVRPAPEILVTVPWDTDVRFEGCSDLTIEGGARRVLADVTDGGRGLVRRCRSLRARVQDQSVLRVYGHDTSIEAAVTDQSQLYLDDGFTRVDLTVADQSQVLGSGTYGGVYGAVTDQSEVTLTGTVGDHNVSTSDQSSFRINGHPAATRRPAAPYSPWGF